MGASAFDARGVGSIVVKPGDPNTIYAASVRSGRGASSVVIRRCDHARPWCAAMGLVQIDRRRRDVDFPAQRRDACKHLRGDTAGTIRPDNGTACSPRGVRQVELDPADPNTVYASSYARGVWRSNDGGATWTQIKASLNSAQNDHAGPMLAVNLLPNGDTRMYVAEGNVGAPYAPSVPQRQRADRRARLRRPHQQQPGESGLRIIQLLHRPVLVR